MTPGVRKLALTAHVIASVGWLGAVAGFLGLAVVGLTTGDPHVARGAYLVMEATGWVVLVPFAVASLVSGVVQSLATRWGLLRHYWVVAKLLINVFATVVLLMYMQTLASLGNVADDVGVPRSPSPALHAGAALLLLVVATTLAVVKPHGLTPYGRRKQREQPAGA